jgi:mono/diheme cytochrome c family protein
MSTWTAIIAAGGIALALAAGEAAAQPAPARIEPDVPAAESVTYRDDIQPLFERAGCAALACHGAGRGAGGLSLSLFGGEPELDYEAIVAGGRGRLIDRTHPGASRLVAVLTGAAGHPEAGRLAAGSPEAARLVAWIAQGARLEDPRRPALVSLSLLPTEQQLAPGARGPLVVQARYADGTTRDVTAEATLRSREPSRVEVAPGGGVTAKGDGEAIVLGTYRRRSAVARVLVPRDCPDFPDEAPNNRIDELVTAKLRRLGIPPSPVCDDAIFLRRAALDVTGTLPTAEEARAFLADPSPGKRAKLIDDLLGRESYVDYWALKWGDLLKIKSEYPTRLWPKAVAVYAGWVREQVARDAPLDEFARALVTASGSNFRDGPANYLRAVSNKDAQSLAEATAMVFLGQRIACARCHAHPEEGWTPDDGRALAACFARVAYKPSNEWKEEIVHDNPAGVVKDPRTGRPVAPGLPGVGPLAVSEGEDPRVALAAWLTSPENPAFAPSLANRAWSWLMGRGIVHEPDDFRPTNPPENPELLAYLTRELVDHRFDMKHLFRLILNSKTYQRSSVPRAGDVGDREHFARRVPRRMPAEALLDAISAVTGVPDGFSSRIPEPFSYLPADQRAIALTDGNIEEAPFPFLELFGRPPRDTSYEGERCASASLRQALYLSNSEHLEGKIATSPRLKALLASGKPDGEVVAELYATMLGRAPRDDERATATAYLGRDPKGRAQALRDLTWALFNTKEFLFIH